MAQHELFGTRKAPAYLFDHTRTHFGPMPGDLEQALEEGAPETLSWIDTYDGTHGGLTADETRSDWDPEDIREFEEAMAEAIFDSGPRGRQVGMSAAQFTYSRGGEWLMCPPEQRAARFPAGTAMHEHGLRHAQREAAWREAEQAARQAGELVKLGVGAGIAQAGLRACHRAAWPRATGEAPE